MSSDAISMLFWHVGHSRRLGTCAHVMGDPINSDRAILGNIFADFSFEIATLVAEGAATFLAMEQPEDLGALPTGPHEEKGLRTVAFHQASFGVPYAKPTRLLLCTSLDMPDFVYEGLPSYDDQGYYKGPLPSAQGFGKMFW